MKQLIYQALFSFSKQVIQTKSTILPTNSVQNSMVKLSKWISMKSLCSRKQAEDFIKLGLVRIDGKRVYQNLLVPQDANMKAFTPLGVRLEKPITKLWAINKPRGYICSHKDPQNRPTVYSLLPPFINSFGHIVSVGRLDFNSQGLLLLTNDVQLKNTLQNPQANLLRLYRVKVHGRVTPQKLLKMTKKMKINNQQYGPLEVTVDRSLTTNVWLNVSMKTGKNRQIRRIMQKCDLQVNKLVRIAYGRYKLGTLNHGQIKQVDISQGLQKKLKRQKAKTLMKQRPCLIQIDIRENALKIASQQHRLRIEDYKDKKPQIEKMNKRKAPELQRGEKKQEEDSQEDDSQNE